MYILEQSSTQEATEWVVQILNSTYVKSDLKWVVNNATPINVEERNLLLSLLENFRDLFEYTLEDWDTEPGSKPFNRRYCLVPRINK